MPEASKENRQGTVQLLYPMQENVPRMYCTPKIHKDGTPLRPVVDYTGSFICSYTTRALADILAPMLWKTEFHVKKSTDLANFLKDFKLEDNEIFVSHDVFFSVHQHSHR